MTGKVPDPIKPNIFDPIKPKTDFTPYNSIFDGFEALLRFQN